MKSILFNLFSISSISLLIAVSQSISWAGAQTPRRDNRARTASIGGRVTVGGVPAANALVTVAEADLQSRGAPFGVESSQGAFVEVRTDSDGRYRVAGLTEGAYVIRALSKAYVLPKSPFGVDPSRSVTLDEGESRDNIDIALVRGGVITGRVIDAEGRAVIEAGLRLFSLDEKGWPKEQLDPYNSWMFQTDDRGVYRIYGVTAGRYILSAGGEWASGLMKPKSPETFHPDAADRDRAKVIEVKEGAEVTGIDIRLGAGKDAYEAAGRVVDADTGQAVPRVSVLCIEAPDNAHGGTRHGRPTTTDDEGRFVCANLTPGRYELILWEQMQVSSMYYSEKTRFEVTDSNVNGLEVKAIRGSTISGVVDIEGAGDPMIKAKLRRMSVSVQVEALRESTVGGGDYEFPAIATAKIAGDGGFHLTGAPEGMASFYIEDDQEEFSIRRVERDGAEIRRAFEIGRGEQITGVRIVLAQANGTIRGQVEVGAVNLPEGCQLSISVSPIKTTTGNEGMPAFNNNGASSVVADEKGRFVIERLTPGEYELSLTPIVRVSQNQWRNAPGMNGLNQRVTVSGGVETMVKLTLDPARR
jgi:hypothetical protein